MTKQKVLFIDIDGVLFGEYDGYYQLRPGVSSFFVWAGQYFRCEFLTCWSWPRVQTLLESLYIDRRSLKIGYRLWYNLKTDGLDPEQDDFYIIDYNLIPEEIAQIQAWGLSNRYLQVNKEGSTELNRIQQLLIDSAGLGNS
jgi:hypothetical protein